MNAKAIDLKRRIFFKSKNASFFVFLWMFSFMGLINLSSQTLKVYDDIPGRRTYEQSQNIPSKYTCRVRQVGTTTWQNAFVMQTMSKVANNNFVNPNGVKGNGYQDKLNNWTASWIAFEFSGMSVEVEISKVGGAAITKAKVRPVGDATDATIVNGKVYVTLDKNVNINVDIDGQMEDNYTGAGYSGPPVHTISIFGNPVFKVPNISNPRVITVNPGEAIPSSNTNAWDTIYFKPGVHNIGTPYEINSNKVIYIPGNAILYGSIHPVNTWSPLPTNWSVYGSGTLSLEKENWIGDGVSYNKAFTYQSSKVRLEGFVIADPANHTLNLYNPSTNTSEVNTYKNLKILGWRINGDAINTFNNSTVTDCFFRVQDDVFYYGENNVKISNCVTWNDYNGSVLYVTRGANTFEESYFKDIKVIYHRAGWLNPSWKSGRVISFRDRKPGDVIKNVQIKNVLVEDPYPAFGPFNLFFDPSSTGSALVDFSNIVIENVRQDHVEVTVNGYRAKNSMLGLDDTRKFKNITFKNCSYNGKMLGSFADGEFITNPYVENIQFQVDAIPANYTITSSAGANGSISPSSNVSVISNTNQTFTITPNSGYQVDVVTVDGASQGSITSYTFTNVTANHTISATFKATSSTINAFSQIEAESYSSVSGVQTETCGEGGLNIGWIENGDYMVFNNVDFGSGAGSFQARVASGAAGGSIEVRLGSPTGTLVGTCLVTSTGAWQTYTTMNCAISGASGIQNLYLVFKGGANYLFNFNWFKFITTSYTITSSAGANGSISPSGNVTVISNTNQTFTITPNTGYQVDVVTVDGASQGSITSYTFANVAANHTISATFKATSSTINAFSQIEAESYSSVSGVQTETCGEGGLNIGWIENGDYMVFNNVDFGSGAASFEARVGCGAVGGSIEVRLGSPTGTLVGTCLVTSTGAWQTYTTMSCAISGASGIQNLYLVFKGGASFLFNVNWIKFSTASLPDIAALTAWTSGTTFNKVNGNNRLLTVMVMGEHSTSDFNATGVTYGDQAMTKVTDRVIGTGFRTYAALFTLNESGVNAASTGTINVSWSSAPAGFEVYSVLLSNVDQTTPVSNTANNALVGTTVTTSALTAASGDMVIMCGSTENNTTNNFNNGFTKQFESNTAWGDGLGGNKTGTGISETPSFTQSASGRMVLCAMVAKKASSGMKAPKYIADNVEIKNSLQNNIRVYPNPVSNMLNIDFINSEISKDVKIFNTVGQLVYSLRTSKSNAQIDVKALNLKGFVTVQVLSGNEISNYKIVVN